MRKTKQQLFLELTKAIRDNQAANQKLDHAVVKALGINATDGRCFDILDHHGPMPAGELAAAAGLTSGAVTQVIDRLEQKGYAERLADPEDRRRVLVAITERGREAAHGFYGPMAARAMAELSDLSKADLELLADFHRRTTAIQAEAADEILRRSE
ncbi:MAG: MarR family transcriptional regulator [Solirubrobacterales bacterium]|nr:MarR family transcriptional regulator [Solirubrobacterales bacterium]